MRLFAFSRAIARRPDGSRRAGIPAWPVGVVVLALALCLPISAAAEESSDTAAAHSLGVNLVFPDDGLTDGEQLCVALYTGSSPDTAKPPVLSRCLDPGGDAVTFEALPHGDYSVLFPGPGSKFAEPRYQGQLVSTSIPDDERLQAFGIDVDVSLAPEYAGTTARVEVSVFGCPEGTNAGSDKDGWASECQALAGGVPLTLTGTGSIEDAAFRAVTGLTGDTSGRVEFTDLPPGAYELGSVLPENVASDPALFAESSIDGSLGSLDPSATLAVRPTETVAVDVFLVIDEDAAANELVGLTVLPITGSVSGSAESPATGE